jgi:hypothetical protein
MGGRWLRVRRRLLGRGSSSEGSEGYAAVFNDWRLVMPSNTRLRYRYITFILRLVHRSAVGGIETDGKF